MLSTKSPLNIMEWIVFNKQTSNGMQSNSVRRLSKITGHHIAPQRQKVPHVCANILLLCSYFRQLHLALPQRVVG